jgi:4-phytase/acid phosphatase
VAVRWLSAFILLFAASIAIEAGGAVAQTSTPSEIQMVVIVSRHGVRSPTDPTELTAYAAKPWPAWEVAPGYLTPRGATLMSYTGAAYRSMYAAAGLLPSSGCPAADSVYVWADLDERTEATAKALLDGFAPGCGLVAHDAGGTVDPLFHPLPTLGKGEPDASSASVLGALGSNPQAIVPAYGASFAKLDAILGCASATCRTISSVPPSLQISAKTGLAGVGGAVDLASTAVEDFILAYADGKAPSDVGWSAVDRATLLQLSQLHTLKSTLTTQTWYSARALGSNLLAHTVATIDQGASGVRNSKTRVPVTARFVAFAGHDTDLEAIAGILRLRWLVPGYQLNDTPPGGALVFEVHRRASAIEPFVRLYFSAQSLDEMRTLSKDAPTRVPVFVPGCPSLDCPVHIFDAVVNAAIDPTFVGAW